MFFFFLPLLSLSFFHSQQAGLFFLFFPCRRDMRISDLCHRSISFSSNIFLFVVLFSFFLLFFFKLLPINWFRASKHSRAWKKRNAAICFTTKSSFFSLLLLLCLFELLLLFLAAFFFFRCFIVWRVNRVQKNSVIFLFRGLTLCCFVYEQFKSLHLSKKKKRKEDKCQMKRSFFFFGLFVCFCFLF